MAVAATAVVGVAILLACLPRDTLTSLGLVARPKVEVVQWYVTDRFVVGRKFEERIVKKGWAAVIVKARIARDVLFKGEPDPNHPEFCLDDFTLTGIGSGASRKATGIRTITIGARENRNAFLDEGFPPDPFLTDDLSLMVVQNKDRFDTTIPAAVTLVFVVESDLLSKMPVRFQVKNLPRVELIERNRVAPPADLSRLPGDDSIEKTIKEIQKGIQAGKG